MRKTSGLLTALALLSAFSLHTPIASAQAVQMSCLDPESSTVEAANLKASPHGAKRIGKHELQVHWAGGVKTFTDKRPYNIGEIGGINYIYCGYNAALGLHLIDKNDGDHELDSAILLNDTTGAEQPAGVTVAFSADGLYYAVTVQPGGQDGETLIVYDRKTSAVLWKGYSGAQKPSGGDIVAEYSNFRWNDHDQLLADATMETDSAYALANPGKPAKPPTPVTLTRRSNGRWTWSPDLGK
jgi:hypothetical protein